MIISTKRTENIIDEINKLYPEMETKLILKKKDEIRESGKCTLIDKKGFKPYIEILIREDFNNECIVTHELLHALNIKKGFGLSRFTGIGNIPYSAIIESLHSTLEHKDIYKYQNSIGVDTSESNKLKVESAFLNIDREVPLVNYDTILNAIFLLEIIISAENAGIEVPNRIISNFPKTYELAVELNRELFSSEISKAEGFRRTYIKALRIFDKYLEENNIFQINFLKFTENITISYIPSKFQSKVMAEQVFDFRLVNNLCVLMTKKDKQASYIIRNLEENYSKLEKYKKLTVEDLIGCFDRYSIIR